MAKYKVGRGKPPRKSQFGKGRSGNPKGRPRGSKDSATRFKKLLNKTILIRENGKEKRMSVSDALNKSLIAKGISGNVQALKTAYAREQHSENQTAHAPPQNLDADEIEILRQHFPRIQHLVENGS